LPYALRAFRRVKPKLKKGSNARKRTITLEEYFKILKHASPLLQLVLPVALNTGMRTGEIKKLRWSYVYLEEGFIRLPAKVTKEKRTKNIPINHHVREVLNGVKQPVRLVTHDHHDFVFSYEGKPLSVVTGFKATLKIACRRAKVPYGRKVTNGLTFHDIRRTVKTFMTEAGIDKAHRDVILGHTLEGMDVYYIAPTEETLKNVMEKYTNWLDEKIKCYLESVDQSVDKKASQYQ
jgi:integrase